MSDLVEIPAPSLADRQGGALQAVLEAERRAEVWTRRRSSCGRLIVALSLPMGYFLYRGGGIADPSARFVLVLWSLTFACAVICGVAASRAERSIDELLTMGGGRRVQIDDSTGGPDATP